jgi:hypothetical protein
MPDKTTTPDISTQKSAPESGESRGQAVPRYMPNARECALLLLHLIQAKESESGKPLSRFRVSEISLRRLWGRRRITPEFVDDVNEWVFRAGRVLFFAGNSYGVILTSAVESWIRLSSKRIASDTEKALSGEYNFSVLEVLLGAPGSLPEDDG